MLLHELARSAGGDDERNGWKSLSFKGETLYYKISPVSQQRPTYGLQIGIALKPDATNAETEFAHDAQNDFPITDDGALKLAFRWLTKNGVDGLHKKTAAWRKQSDAWKAADDKATASAKKGQKLPTGYKIVDGPKKGHRFVKTPKGDLIPNQGSNDRKTDQDIIDDFYVWKQRAKGV